MKLNRKKTEEVEVDMSPMIDMVFLLLIFFLVASTIIDEKKPVEVPVAVHSKVPEDTDRFDVTVTADGTLWLSPTESVTLDEFKAVLEPRLAAKNDLRILIRADKNVKYKVNEELMEACADVGASDLIFSAFEN